MRFGKRFRFGYWILLLCAANLPAYGATVEKSLAGARPNIILVVTDDQGYAPIGRHGVRRDSILINVPPVWVQHLRMDTTA